MLNCNGINQTLREFDSSHGAFVCVNDWLLFEDGARRERSPLGALVDPPEDLRKRAQNIVQYHQERLNLAIEEFDNFKLNHQIQAHAALKEKIAPAPVDQPESIIKKLRELQKKVKRCRTQLNKAEAELKKHTPQRIRDLEAMSNKNREANQQLLSELESIEI